MSELTWRKSARCEAANCVEVASADAVLVRDTKDPTGPILSFTPKAWASFLSGLRAGDLRS